jgi:CBS domain-containing protein
MNVGEVCAREVYIVRPHEPLVRAVDEMCKRNVGSVIVVEQRDQRIVPVGILTDRDVVGLLGEKGDMLEVATVGECMSGNLLTLGEDESVVDAMARLRGRGVRRAPVVAADGGLVGIVSADDLLGVVAEQLSSLARLVERQTSDHRVTS